MIGLVAEVATADREGEVVVAAAEHKQRVAAEVAERTRAGAAGHRERIRGGEVQTHPERSRPQRVQPAAFGGVQHDVLGPGVGVRHHPRQPGQRQQVAPAKERFAVVDPGAGAGRRCGDRLCGSAVHGLHALDVGISLGAGLHGEAPRLGGGDPRNPENPDRREGRATHGRSLPY
jgi:hypothetical protein